jgi:hypothetical protein
MCAMLAPTASVLEFEVSAGAGVTECERYWILQPILALWHITTGLRLDLQDPAVTKLILHKQACLTDGEER